MIGRFRTQIFDVDDIRVRLRTPRRLKESAGVSREAFPVFGMVWPSGELLAIAMREYPIAGKRILEVGCGMALASHVLNLRGADVTALDIHPVVGELLSNNARANRADPIAFVTGSFSDAGLNIGKFDLIIASDVLYEPGHARELPAFIDRHGATACEVVVADPERGGFATFMDGMAGQGFVPEARPMTVLPDQPYDIRVERLVRGQIPK